MVKIKPLIFKNRKMKLKKAISSPDLLSKTVLVNDPWNYVALWLKNHHRDNEKARFFWEQAGNYYQSAISIPKTSSPLLAYYCMLNATKALLEVKKITYNSNSHGVCGKAPKNNSVLKNEKVIFKGNGVLSALCRAIDENCKKDTINLKHLLRNLPYIHRAYNLTFKSDSELFIPIEKPRFVVIKRRNKVYFTAEITSNFASNHTINKLPDCYERDLNFNNTFSIRDKKRINWKYKKSEEDSNVLRLLNYLKRVRKNTHYIFGNEYLWYIKRNNQIPGVINRSSISLTFAGMHRLSELSRYNPLALKKHFDSKHNFLLNEFIDLAPRQFIDEIATEMTGKEFMIPGTRSKTS